MSQDQGPNPYNKRKEAGLSLLNQFFYILTFFYKYVFFPLLNKINYV